MRPAYLMTALLLTCLAAVPAASAETICEGDETTVCVGYQAPSHPAVWVEVCREETCVGGSSSDVQGPVVDLVLEVVGIVLGFAEEPVEIVLGAYEDVMEAAGETTCVGDDARGACTRVSPIHGAYACAWASDQHVCVP